MQKSKITNIVGFDLGHAKTALTYMIGYNTATQPQKVFPQGHDVTAIAYGRNPDGKTSIQWGETAFSNFANSNGVEAFDIGFKMRPGTDPDLDKLIQDFAGQVYRDAIKEVPQIRNAGTVECFIGCPSAWSENDRKQYKKIFQDAGLPNPTIVSESDAAFAYYYDSILTKEQSTGQRSLKLSDYGKPVLLLDFGSSTLDATLAAGMEFHTDGVWLGGGLIDRAILEWNLQHYQSSDYPIKRGIPKGYADDVRNFLEQDPAYRALALLHCRRAKEEYFSKAANFTRQSPLRKGDFIDDVQLHYCIYTEMMEEILNTPLEEIVYDFDSLDDDYINDLTGYSWMKRCEKFLKEDFLRTIRAEKNLKLSDIALVILTGGASLMPQVRNLVKSVFSHLPENNYFHDTEPMMCIARGLTYWGRNSLREMDFAQEVSGLPVEIVTSDEPRKNPFESEVDAFCENTETGLVHIVLKHYATTTLPLILGDKIGDIYEDNFSAWRKEIIDANRIGYFIRKEVKEWSESKELKKEVVKELKRIERDIRDEVNEMLAPIAKKYRLGEINFLNESFMTGDLALIVKRYQEEHGEELDYEELEGVSFTDLMLNIAQALANAIQEGISDEEFSNLGDGWGFWRRFKMSEEDIEKMKDNLQEKSREAIGEVLANEDILKGLVLFTYICLQTILARKIKAAKFMMAHM